MVEWRNARRQQPTGTAARRRVDAMHANLSGQGSARESPEPPESPELSGADAEEAVTSVEPAGHLAAPLARRRRLSGAVQDRLPARMQDLTGRGSVSGHHVAVLAVLLACALALSAWWLVAGRASPQPVAAPAPAVPIGSGPSLPTETGSSAAVPTAASTDVTASSSETVIVDVAGKVRDPGIVTLPAGSRVVDALEAAGGARESVDLTALNLARELVDGEQLLVGLAPMPGIPQPAPPSSSGTTGPIALVDLNTATLTELDTLPGVGPVTGQAILDWRADNGSFTSVDELLEVDGIGDAILTL